MDTRSKILTVAEAAALAGPLAMVTGYFDVIRAGHLRDLDRVRRRSIGAKILAVVLPAPDEILPQRARAELAAALRVIDYVVIADTAAARRLAASLEPVEISHLETADIRRARGKATGQHKRENSWEVHDAATGAFLGIDHSFTGHEMSRSITGSGSGPVRGRSRLALSVSHVNTWRMSGGLVPLSAVMCFCMPGKDDSILPRPGGADSWRGGGLAPGIGRSVASSSTHVPSPRP